MAAGQAPASSTARATQVRSRRAALTRQIKNMAVDGYALVAGDQDGDVTAEERVAIAADMPIEKLLCALPGVDVDLAWRVLSARSIPPSTRLFGLTIERRQEIVAAIRKELS